MRETPRPSGARTGGHGPTGQVNLTASGGKAIFGGGSVEALGQAVERNIALPIKPVQSVVTRPDATPTEKRRWLEEEGLHLRLGERRRLRGRHAPRSGHGLALLRDRGLLGRVESDPPPLGVRADQDAWWSKNDEGPRIRS